MSEWLGHFGLAVTTILVWEGSKKLGRYALKRFAMWQWYRSRRRPLK